MCAQDGFAFLKFEKSQAMLRELFDGVENQVVCHVGSPFHQHERMVRPPFEPRSNRVSLASKRRLEGEALLRRLERGVNLAGSHGRRRRGSCPVRGPGDISVRVRSRRESVRARTRLTRGHTAMQKKLRIVT